MDIFCQQQTNNMQTEQHGCSQNQHSDIWHGVLVMRDTDLISKTPPLLLGRLDIRSLGEGIAFIARLRGGAPHSALSHTHRDLREERVGRKKRKNRAKDQKAILYRRRKRRSRVQER